MESNYSRRFMGDYDSPSWNTYPSYQEPASQTNYFETEPSFRDYHGGNFHAQFNNFANFGGNMSRSQHDYSNVQHFGFYNHPNHSWSKPIEMRSHPPLEHMHEERPSLEDMMFTFLQNQQNQIASMQNQAAQNEARFQRMKVQQHQMMSMISEMSEDAAVGPVDCDHPEVRELEDTLQSFDEVLTVVEDVVDEAMEVVVGGDIVEEGVMPHDVEEIHEDMVEAVTLESGSQMSDDDACNSDDEGVNTHTEEAHRSNILSDYITSFVLPSPSPHRVPIREQDKQFLHFLDISLELPIDLSVADLANPLSTIAIYLEWTPKRKRKLDIFGEVVLSTECSTVKKHKLSPKLLEFHPP